jgi:hypothetical protein
MTFARVCPRHRIELLEDPERDTILCAVTGRPIARWLVVHTLSRVRVAVATRAGALELAPGIDVEAMLAAMIDLECDRDARCAPAPSPSPLWSSWSS